MHSSSVFLRAINLPVPGEGAFHVAAGGLMFIGYSLMKVARSPRGFQESMGVGVHAGTFGLSR
jgi:hypothetical protein